MKTGTFLLVISILISGYNSFSEENRAPEQLIDVLGRTTDIKEIKNLINDMYTERQVLSVRFIRLLKKETNPDRKGWLIYLAGKLRLESATGELIRNLDFVDVGPSMKTIGLPIWSPFPSQDALIKIGMGSVEYLVDELAGKYYGHPDILVLNTIRLVIIYNVRHVDSIELTKLILEGNYKDEKDPKKKENLKKAIDLISQENYLALEEEYRRTVIRKAKKEYKNQEKKEVKTETTNP